MTASASRRPTILIVDDSPGVRQSLQYLLSPHLRVAVAESGADALAALSPDTALVLTDVRMPGMNGLEFTRALRRTHPDLKVVFMTEVGDDDVRDEAQALGVLAVLRKPLRPGRLFPALQGWLAAGTPASPELGDAPGPAAVPDSGPAPATGPTLRRPSGGQSPIPSAQMQGARAQMYVAGLSVLPGVSAACVFDQSGAPVGPLTLPDAAAPALHALLVAAQALSEPLAVRGPLKVTQLEFQDRVLVLCAVPHGFVVAVVRDTPGASSVKSWMRSRLGR